MKMMYFIMSSNKKITRLRPAPAQTNLNDSGFPPGIVTRKKQLAVGKQAGGKGRRECVRWCLSG